MGTVEARTNIPLIEWQTLALIVLSYGFWTALLYSGPHLSALFWIVLSAINLTLFMSITHEVIHGHPTRIQWVNRLLILLPIAWSIPYERFRDTHIDHHETDQLTDPFDDPESWYLAQHDWIGRFSVTRSILAFNNTLFGRMLIGPVIGLGRFYASELHAILSNRNGNSAYLISVWVSHLLLCGLMTATILRFSSIPLWQWVSAIYFGHSLLLVRTFLEHQAAPGQSERTVIIETPCPIAFLFLFNNYHFVHHAKPHIPWYRLPAEYRQQKERYIAENGAYVYRSYSEVFRRYFFHAKEPVSHPFLRTSPGAEGLG